VIARMLSVWTRLTDPCPIIDTHELTSERWNSWKSWSAARLLTRSRDARDLIGLHRLRVEGS
jgi:hypothetical protein